MSMFIICIGLLSIWIPKEKIGIISHSSNIGKICNNVLEKATQNILQFQTLMDNSYQIY